MFERRLKVLLGLPLVCIPIIVARLFQLQVVRGEYFHEQAEAALVSPVQFLPPLRGRILDRTGVVLVSDEPTYDVTVHYGVLSMDPAYLLLLAERWSPRAGRSSAAREPAEEIRDCVARMWSILSDAAGLSLSDLRHRRDEVCDAVERLRRHVENARRRRDPDAEGGHLRLREEELFHSIIRDVSPSVRTRIELELSGLPFIRIEPSVRRVWSDDAAPFCHTLGRLGEVSPDVIENDPARDDWLACYRAGDSAGVSGVERLGEPMLRGRRGYDERLLDGTLKSHRPPVDGLDVQLSIDAALQRRIAEILRRAVAENPPSTGAAAVVLDVRTREVLALVSVPTYTDRAFRGDYAALRDDTLHRPLLFRAVSEEFPPGSTIKPVAALAGLSSGVVGPAETTFCDGTLIPGSSSWHCWTHWRGMAGHGDLSVEEAIQHSCNIYFYHLGQRVNAQRLTDFYRRFILGPDGADGGGGGTGLIAERFGLIPSKAWLKERFNRDFRPGDGRNYAIGQGEFQLTPLQVANVYATIAAGRFREPTLVANDGRPRPSRPVAGVRDEHWKLVRRGLYRCVNEEGGTAFKYARMENVELCGKTGSAQCAPRVVQWRYYFESAAGGESLASVVAPTIDAARGVLGLPSSRRCVKREIVQTFPPPDPETGKRPTHAWFAGFAPYDEPRIALAVVIEFGGSGQAAATVSKDVLGTLMDGPAPVLRARADAVARGEQ